MAGPFGTPTASPAAGGMSPAGMKTQMSQTMARTPRQTPGMGMKGPPPMTRGGVGGAPMAPPGGRQAPTMQEAMARGPGMGMQARVGPGGGSGAMAPQAGSPQAQQMQQWLAARKAAPPVGQMPGMTGNKGFATIASPPIR